ncbi:TNFAIP3-interacting protein 2 [Stigmatopora nigra]
MSQPLQKQRAEVEKTWCQAGLFTESRRQEAELLTEKDGFGAEFEARLRATTTTVAPSDESLDNWWEEFCQLKQTKTDDPLKGDTQQEISSDALEYPNSQIQQLQEENEQLKRRISYVQSLNSQWQKYDSTREDYIRGLRQRFKSAPAGEAGAASSTALRREVVRLNASLEDKIDECARLRKEAGEERDRVRMLEQQAVIYAEDFKSERADRERAQGRLQDLKEQIGLLKQQLRQQEASRKKTDVVPLCHVHIGHRVSSSSRWRRTSDDGETTTAAPRCPRCTAALEQDVGHYFIRREDGANW